MAGGLSGRPVQQAHGHHRGEGVRDPDHDACAGRACWGTMPLGLAAIFLMGMHSAIFGPSKYGLLPELLPERRLSWGNGMLELGTFLAIILGMVAAAAYVRAFPGRQVWSGMRAHRPGRRRAVISLGITRVPAADPAQDGSAQLPRRPLAHVRLMRRDRTAVAGVCRQHLLLVHRRAAAAEPVRLRRERAARRRGRKIGLPQRGAGDRHRAGQLCGRLPVGRQDRIRPGAAGLARALGLRGACSGMPA